MVDITNTNVLSPQVLKPHEQRAIFAKKLPEISKSGNNLIVSKWLPSDLQLWGLDHGADMMASYDGQQMNARMWVGEPNPDPLKREKQDRVFKFYTISSNPGTKPIIMVLDITYDQAKQIRNSDVYDLQKSPRDFLPKDVQMRRIENENNGSYDGVTPERIKYEEGCTFNGILDILFPENTGKMGLAQGIAEKMGWPADKAQGFLNTIKTLRTQRGHSSGANLYADASNFYSHPLYQ